MQHSDGTVVLAYKPAVRHANSGILVRCCIPTTLATAVDLLFTRAQCVCVCYLTGRLLELEIAANSNVPDWVSRVSHIHSSGYSCSCAIYQTKVHACYLPEQGACMLSIKQGACVCCPYRQAVGAGNSSLFICD